MWRLWSQLSGGSSPPCNPHQIISLLTQGNQIKAPAGPIESMQAQSDGPPSPPPRSACPPSARPLRAPISPSARPRAGNARAHGSPLPSRCIGSAWGLGPRQTPIQGASKTPRHARHATASRARRQPGVNERPRRGENNQAAISGASGRDQDISLSPGQIAGSETSTVQNSSARSALQKEAGKRVTQGWRQEAVARTPQQRHRGAYTCHARAAGRRNKTPSRQARERSVGRKAGQKAPASLRGCTARLLNLFRSMPHQHRAQSCWRRAWKHMAPARTAVAKLRAHTQCGKFHGRSGRSDRAEASSQCLAHARVPIAIAARAARGKSTSCVSLGGSKMQGRPRKRDAEVGKRRASRAHRPSR